jgi:hypothetical protein
VGGLPGRDVDRDLFQSPEAAGWLRETSLSGDGRGAAVVAGGWNRWQQVFHATGDPKIRVSRS